jgi:predicted ATP-dependent protease
VLSALAEVPIKQSFAVTGSVDQLGRVQPIGGANEKIEGFFDVCRTLGSTGQGVIIPAANINDLMLRQDVVEAAGRGGFSIFAVETVDQALELLMGLPPGTRNEAGLFPAGSVNALVEDRLKEMSDAVTALAQTELRGDGKNP